MSRPATHIYQDVFYASETSVLIIENERSIGSSAREKPSFSMNDVSSRGNTSDLIRFIELSLYCDYAIRIELIKIELEVRSMPLAKANV